MLVTILIAQKQYSNPINSLKWLIQYEIHIQGAVTQVSLILTKNLGFTEVPEAFLHNFTSLRVLELSSIQIESLPGNQSSTQFKRICWWEISISGHSCCILRCDVLVAVLKNKKINMDENVFPNYFQWSLMCHEIAGHCATGRTEDSLDYVLEFSRSGRTLK